MNCEFANRLTSQLIALSLLAFMVCGCGSSSNSSMHSANGPKIGVGSESQPLRVLMIPADGGTEEGTIADFEPVFRAITREYGLHFDLKVAQSYTAVVEGLVNKKVDVAWMGPVTFHEARRRGAAELLAVGVTNGESVYYSGIFVQKQAMLETVQDLRNREIALGDVNSASSFSFPVAMLLNAGVDPVKDLSQIYLTGSHANALAALAAGQVDAAGASLSSFEKAVTNGQIDPNDVVLLGKSDPIPYPPMAMHVELPEEIKSLLKEAFHNVHNAEGITESMLIGYGGKRVDRYDAEYSEEEFDRAMAMLSNVTDELKEEILLKASER